MRNHLPFHYLLPLLRQRDRTYVIRSVWFYAIFYFYCFTSPSQPLSRWPFYGPTQHGSSSTSFHGYLPKDWLDVYVSWSLACGHRAEFTLSRKTDSAVFLSQFQFLAPNDFLTIPNPFTFFYSFQLIFVPLLLLLPDRRPRVVVSPLRFSLTLPIYRLLNLFTMEQMTLLTSHSQTPLFFSCSRIFPFRTFCILSVLFTLLPSLPLISALFRCVAVCRFIAYTSLL